MAPDLEKEREVENQQDSDSSSNRDMPFNSVQEPRPEEHVLDPRPLSDITAVAESAPPPDEHVYITGWKLFSVISTATLACFTMLLDQTIIATAIPKITTEFHSLNDIGWYGASYLLASSALQPLTGKFYTYFGAKLIFIIFLCIFEIGSLIAGVATSSNMLIVGRAISGLGGSGIMNGALTMVSTCVPIHKRATYMGIMMATAQLGVVSGPLIGGAFTEYATWRWCFYINLPIGGLVAGVLAIFIKIPDSQNKIRTATNFTFRSTVRIFDLIGFVIFAPTAIMFLLALQWGGSTYPWDSPKVIGLLCGSAGGLVVFVIWEYRQGDDAMFPSSVVKRLVVLASFGTYFFFSACIMLVSYYLSMYFQAVKGKSPMMSGVYVLPQIISQMIGAVTSGILVTRLGYYLPWSVLSGILLTVSTGLFSTFDSSTPIGQWIGFQVIAGIGRGCGLQMPLIAVQNYLPEAQMPLGTTLLVFSQQFGGAIWLSLGETTFSSGLTAALKNFAPGMSAKAILGLGATGFRAAVPVNMVEGVVKSYTIGVRDVFYLGTACGVVVFLLSWGLGWKSVKKVKKVEDVEGGAAGEKKDIDTGEGEHTNTQEAHSGDKE